jgi:hypothetical protein
MPKVCENIRRHQPTNASESEAIWLNGFHVGNCMTASGQNH